MESEWQQDVIPYPCVRYFKLQKNEQGTKINDIITKSIPDAQSILEMA